MTFNRNHDIEREDALRRHYESVLLVDLIVAEANIMMVLRDNGQFLSLSPQKQAYLELSLQIVQEEIGRRLYRIA